MIRPFAVAALALAVAAPVAAQVGPPIPDPEAAPAPTPSPVPAPAPAATAADTFLAANRRKPGVIQTESGLQYQVLAPGDRAGPPGGHDVALVIYEGRLSDGTVFDRSPWAAPLPVGGLVPGFAEALRLMSNGARYRVWIKPDLAYGPDEIRDGSGRVVIPANSVLTFDIRLLDFIPLAQYRTLTDG